MYDLPELQGASDALGAAIAARLGVSGVRTRGDNLHALWTDPGLLLSQTCGYPLVTSLAKRVTLVATPCYTAPGCEGPLYRSAIVVRAADPACTLADLRGRRCAINAPDSQSGMNALRLAVHGARFFGGLLVTGAHVASVDAVARGDADVAAIDCVTWAHLRRWRPAATAELRVLQWTSSTPGLPLITSTRTTATTLDALILALRDVAQDPALGPARDALLLHGFERVPLAAYEAAIATDGAAEWVRATVSAAHQAGVPPRR